jgi:hypothetical protein
VDVYIHILLTSILVGDEWSASGSGRFSPGERAPGTHWIRGWMGHRAGVGELLPSTNSERFHLIAVGLMLADQEQGGRLLCPFCGGEMRGREKIVLDLCNFTSRGIFLQHSCLYAATQHQLGPMWGVLERIVPAPRGEGSICGTVSGMRTSRGNRRTRRKRAPMLFRPPQIPHDRTWNRTEIATVRSSAGTVKERSTAVA